MRKIEIPVLLLKIESELFILITTERFIKFENSVVEELDYKDFEWHSGYKIKNIQMKKDGSIGQFGLKKIDGEIIYWKIPTGSSGYGFWNVTKKCELIGRKYEIVK